MNTYKEYHQLLELLYNQWRSYQLANKIGSMAVSEEDLKTATKWDRIKLTEVSQWLFLNDEIGFPDGGGITLTKKGIGAYAHGKYIREKNKRVWDRSQFIIGWLGVISAAVAIAISLFSNHNKESDIADLQNRLHKIEIKLK